MPELPEVEDAASRFRTAALGQMLKQITVSHPSQRRTLPKRAITPLIGTTVVSVTRRAKLQLVALSDGSVLAIHFRMNGDWDIGRTTDTTPRHERVRFDFKNGVRISLVDSRALSVVEAHAPGTWSVPEFGPEPLSDAWTAADFRTALTTRRGPIKPVLLDQRVLAGLGNIYAAEALWEARIDPRTLANTISKARVERLHGAIREVLHRAPAGRYFQDGGRIEEAGARRVYGREGEACVRCGKHIKRIVQAGRSTYWCSGCQR